MKEHDPTGEKEPPLIVFAGRSNVGKSSIIRALTGKKIIVGKRPGSTRWEQLIEIGPITIADIPGFGFMAGQSKATIENTKTRIIQSLEKWSDRILLSILIIDLSLFRKLYDRWSSRNEIPVDVEFYSFLCEISPRVIVVANKVDKLKSSHIQDELDFLVQKFRESVIEREPTVVVTNALKKKGVSLLRDLINESLKEEGIEPPMWALT
jgi:GTP-binding protein EngB required for normal cell division